MGRRIILNLAVSLDGYIADEEGDYDWIVGDGSQELDTFPEWEHTEFLKNVDIVVMGKNCYDQGFAKDYPDKTVYVATTKELQDHGNIRFIRGDICARIIAECAGNGGNVFLFGGGKLCDGFIKENIIDEYIIGIIPVILGKGRPLFLGGNPTIKLRLMERFIDGGIVILRYEKCTGGGKLL